MLMQCSARASLSRQLLVLLICLLRPASQDPVVRVIVHPGQAVARQAFGTQPYIELRDSATDAIIYQDYKIKCDHSLGTASVLGDAYVKVNGSYQFTDLRFPDPGSGYQLSFQLYSMQNTILSTVAIAVSDFFINQPPFLALRGRSRPTGEIGAGKPLTPIPSIELTDVDQKILPLGDNVVFLSITETSAQPRDLPLLIMKATVNALTCCRAANCEQLKVKMQIECDCSHKDAALCAVPTNGYVGFHDVRVNKMGQHKLSYRHVEIMPDGTVKTYTFTDSESFTIIPGNTEGLQIVTNPQTVMMGNITGDEPALLDPQPVCGYTDDQLNTIPMSSETFVMAIPCLDFSDTRIESLPPRLLDPPRYCPCNDTACHLQLKRVRDVQSFGGATFGGNLIGRFDSIGMARFTDLNTRLARNDLRVICRFTEPDEARLDDPRALADPLFAYILSQDYVITSTFVVYPGRLQRLMPLVGPGNYSGCARCQHGVHLLLGRLQATVQLLDSADNELVACTPASRFCRGAPTAMIKVRLYDADDNVVDNQPEGNLQGIIEVDAVQGKAYFNEVRVRSAGKGYYLRFHSQGTDFKAGGLTSTNIIHADSEPFAVVNGAPAVIDLDTAAPLIGADAEVFQVQPVLFVRDAGGNIVYSDCYNDCAETIGEQCALVSSDTPDSCASAVEVSLVAANDATLFGTTTVIARGGVVVFTDLGIDSGGDCYPPAPYPNYMIQMSLVGIDDLPIDVPVKLERRVSKLIFVDQPKLSVALETFSTDVVVQVVNCVSDVVPTATGSISIGIRDDAGEREPGVLTGSTRLRVERGQVTFSDLSIQSEGVGYTLIISYHSLAVVPDVLSALFNIEPAVVSIQLLISPTGAVKAGDPFASQPSVILRDFQNNVVLNSKAKITASIGDNPGKMQAWDYDQSILHGARVVSAANGKASFKDLALHKASRGQELASEFYTLVFVFRSMRTVTAYFSVIPNAWADLLIEPSTHPVTTKAGQPFPRHVRVLLVDAFKNKLQNGTVPAGTYVDVLVETPLTRLGSYMNSDPVLLKHGCHEICQGSRPVVCTTCSDKRLNAQSGDVLFTDLRLDMVGQGYRLTFTCESFNQTSEAFDVTHANASYLHVATQPSPECNADKELIRQPAVSVHDKFGNLIMADGVVIEARLTSRERLLPRAAGFPPVPGQEPNTICRVSDVPMTGTRFLNATGGVANFTDLAVRPAMSGFKLEFFGTSSRGVLSINSSEFTVEAGIAVGICNMTLPRRCSALSPCLGHTTIACVDAHGNVQPTCSTCIGDRCNIRPYGTLPMGMNLACHGMVCVSILAPSFGTLRQGSGRTSGINCAQGLCGASINPETGFATFTQLVLDIPSPDYVLKFSTFVVEKRSRLIYEWSYVTPSIENLPGAPILTSATFSMALNSIALKFDRPTSMNNLSDTCKAVIDEEFQQSLGANPSCTWTSKSEFLIVPGIGAYANQSTRVLLSKASNIVYDDVFVGVHMESGAASTINGTVVEGIVLPPVFLSLPHKLVKPDATILGAQELSACDLLDADASLSSGSASRPFKDIHWSVDYDETYLYQGLLTSAGTVYKFFKSSIHFSTMLPNMINTVTITLRPSAQVHANSTISITGIPPYYPSSRGCPASPYELSQPCVEDSCRLLELEGPSAFLFSSHLKPNLLEVPVSWWQVGVSRLFASIDFHLPTGITLDEFSMVLQETGDYVGTVQALHRFQTADVDSDNSISEEEFINNRPISFQTFSAMDIDTSGLLDPTELKTALQSSGDFVNDKQINALFQGLDSNQNGLVSEDEFKAAPVLVMNARHLQYRPAAFQGLHGGLSLHVHESHFLSSSSDTVIRFKIQNPPLPWDTQPITIQSKCTECICMNYEICDVKTSQIFEAQAMKMDCSGPRCKSDAEFNVENPFVSISGSMTETSRVNGARNVLTLGFNTSHVLPPKSGIVIKGLPLAWQLPLAGSTSGREKVIDVCLIGPSAKYFACLSCPNKARARAAGRWFTEVGEIHLQVNFGGSLSTDYHEVSWNFYNPTNMMRTACKSTDIPGSVMESAECPSAVRPTLHVSYDYARAAADCNVDPALCVPGTEAMTPASKGINHGVLGAGESAAWSRAQVSESNSFAEFVSHLLIEVEANVELFQMTTINVSGFPSQRRPMGRSEKCMSEIGSGSLDCWAGCHGEEFACEDGYIASVSRNESRMIMGQSCLKYTCLPQSACSASMCAGHQVNGGHQCWACDEDSLSCLSGYTVLGMTGKALVQSNGAVCREYVCCKESIPVSWNPTKHAVLPLSGVIAQDGNMLECFDDASVAWNNDGTELLWRIQHTDSSQNCYVPSRSTLRFAIPIVNPSMKSEFDDFALSIRAEHHGCTDCVLDACACSDAASSPTRPWNLPPVLLQRSILTAQDGKKSFQPLLTSSHYLDLVRPTISESNSVAGQFATITMSFRPTFAMLAGSNITISGLRPSATATTDNFPVQNSLGLVRTARFEADTGTLLFSLVNVSSANSVFSVSFVLKHVSTAAAAENKTVRATIKTPVCLHEKNSHCAWLSQVAQGEPVDIVEQHKQLTGSALGIHEQRAMRIHKVSETTQVVGALNIITVDLQANFEMFPGYTLTLTSIAGNKMSSIIEAGLTAVPTRLSLFPNCSCVTGFEHVCTTCTSAGQKANLVQFRVWQPDHFFGSPIFQESTGSPMSGTVDGAWIPAESGDKEAGNTLKIVVKKLVPAERLWKFAFVLRNPGLSGLKPKISISDNASQPIISGQSLNGTVFSGVQKDCAFTSVSMQEDSSILSVQTNITLSFISNCPLISLSALSQGATITISGLKGYETPSGYVKLLGAEAYMFGKRAVARWDKEEGTLLFEGVSLPGNCFPPSDTCWLPERSTITFWLKARQSIAAGQTFPVIEAKDGIGDSFSYTLQKQVIGGVPLNKAVNQPAIVSASIVYSSMIQGDTCNLTLSFVVNTHLPGDVDATHSSSLVLGGLLGVLNPDNDKLPIYGADAALFKGSSGVWKQLEGSLSLTVAADTSVEAGYNVQISMLVLNPIKEQSELTPTLSAVVRYPPQTRHDPWVAVRSSPMVSVSPVPLLHASVTGRGVLTAAVKSTFTTKLVHETSQVNFAANTISLTLAANIDLPSGVAIVVKGFRTSTQYNTNEMEDLFGPSSALFGGKARFDEVMLSNGDTDVKLTMVLKSKVTSFEELVLSFVLQNRECSVACSPHPITVTAKGSNLWLRDQRLTEREWLVAQGFSENVNVDFLEETMENPRHGVMASGGALSWTQKNVWEATNVLGEPNMLFIELQVNARLYEGTRIVLTGLGYWFKTCFDCFATKRAYGSGCSALCDLCEDSVGGKSHACVPVFEDELSNPHPFFKNSQGKWQNDPEQAGYGSLVLTIQERIKIVETSPFKIVLKMRNRNAPAAPEARKECWKESNQNSNCLKVTIANGKLCTEISVLTEMPTCKKCTEIYNEECRIGDMKSQAEECWSQAEECRMADMKVAEMAVGIGGTMDHYKTPLLDTCSTCLRPADIVALDRVLQKQKSLILTDIAVSAPSIDGMPLLIQGGLVPGNYTIRLSLENWLNQTASRAHAFSKDLGVEGLTGTEDLKPTVYIQGVGQVSSDRYLTLQALAQAASCLPNAPRQVLRYVWTMSCLGGSCSLLRPLSEVVPSVNTRSLYFRSGALIPGVSYQFEVRAQQDDTVVKQSKSKMSVSVPVRPLIVDIIGVSADGLLGAGGGQKRDLDLAIWDPEFYASQLSTDEHFKASWGCYIQLKHTEDTCPSTQPICPQADFVPCVHGTLEVVQRPCDKIDPNCDHAASLHALEVGSTYKVEVNVSRELFKLPLEIFNYMVPNPRIPTEWIQEASTTRTFEVVPGKAVSVSASVCSPIKLGTPDLCKPPVPAMVLAEDKLVLKALGRSTPAIIGFKSFEWSVESATDAASDLLRRDNKLAELVDLYSGVLVLKPGVLTPGRTTTIRITATDLSNDVGTARVHIHVRMPPSGGRLSVEPARGLGMSTRFDLMAVNWAADAESLPLTFGFFCGEEDGDASAQLPLESGSVFSVRSFLPTAQASSHRLVVGVRVTDIFSASVQANTSVLVESAARANGAELLPLLESALLTDADTMFRVGDVQNVQGLVGVIAQTLNSEPACALSDSGCPSGNTLARQTFRARLLLTVQAANRSLTPTPSALSQQASVILKILDRPAEINFETAEIAMRLVSNSIAAIRHAVGTSRVHTQALAHVLGIAAVRLLEALRFSSLLLAREPLDDVGPSSPLTMRARSPAGGTGSKAADSHSAAETLAAIALGRSGSVAGLEQPGASAYPDPDPTKGSRGDESGDAPNVMRKGSKYASRALTASSLRHFRYKLLHETLAKVSSLSVAQEEAGSDPVVLRLPGCTVNTSIVRKGSMQLTGWRAEGNGTAFVAVLPPSLLEEMAGGDALADLEVMHVFCDGEGGLGTMDQMLGLPPSFGPHFFLQLRRKGSDKAVRFNEPLTLPWQLYCPVTVPVPERQNTFLGSRAIAFGAFFDYDEARYSWEQNWFWSTQGLSLKTRPSINNDFVLRTNVRTLAYSLFSVWQVEEGCDGVPESAAYKDHCAVCGGDNSTCSGCDGIPNTGRDKQCSGHGECRKIEGLETIRCQCIDKWYDIMCSNFCDNKADCSGHGLCHPDDGARCLCFQGWLHGEAKPHCKDPDPNTVSAAPEGAGPNKTAIALQAAATQQFVLTILLPAIGGALLLCFAGYRIGWRRRIQEAKWRETMIFYPQPQLAIKAEDRPDEIMAAPDENGWSNIDLPHGADASSSFMQGPAGGQLASQASTQARLQVSRLAQDAMTVRATSMRSQMKSKNTVIRYITGPEAEEPEDIDVEVAI